MDMLNRPVTHARFGAGVIKSCENGTLQVYFQQYGARFFHYPEVFDRFLSPGDQELAAQVDADLAEWRAGRAAEDERLAASIGEAVKAARTVKKPAARRRMPARDAAK